MTGEWLGTGSEIENLAYSQILSASDSTLAFGSTYLTLGAISYNDPSTTVSDTVQWIRTRVAPPNNIMPSVEFGTLTASFGAVTTSYTYNPSTGWMLTSTNPNGQTTTYQYDNLGRVTAIIYPDESQEIIGYNDQNNYVTIVNPNGNVTKEYFDGLGRLISTQIYSGGSLYSEENYTYNYLNDVATHTTPAGDTYYYTYDALGRQTLVTNPDSTTERTTYDTVLNSTTYVVISTDENGHSTSYGYNWDNELMWVQQSPTSGITYTTRYSYDQVGNLISETDANGHVTTYKYDSLNRLIYTKYPDGTAQTLTYDSDGNMLTRVDPLGQVTSYSYDGLNRETLVSYPNGTSVSYSYDKDGNVLSEVYSAGSSSSYFTYDSRDRLTNETDVIAGVSYSTLYTYDKDSNILSITYPDGTKTTFTYDALNRLTSIVGIATITYTLDSKIHTITYANGAVTTYTYNSRDMPKSIYSFSGSTELMGLNYTYDNVGNVIGINSETYGYNNMNELTSSSGPWGTTSYSYDGAGNMLNMTLNGVTTTSYGYDSYNRMTSAGSASLSYDSDGNLKQIVNGSTTWNYGYNYENELTSVKKNGVLVESNVYSANGERVEMIQGSNTNVYTFDQSQYNILYEKNLTSGTVIKNYYADGLQLAEVVGGSMYYLIDDALGSVRAVTTPSPVSTVFSTDYKPYGQNYGLSQSLSVLNFEYTHKPYDSSTGLYYYGARFYDPSISRFITEDSPQYANTQNPLTLNRYAYVTNNPETLSDPSGHYVNECVDSPNCPSTNSGGGSRGSGTYGNNPLQSQSQSSSRPICTKFGCIVVSGGTSQASGYWNWLISPNGDLSQTIGWIVGILCSIISPALGVIANQLKAILATSNIIASLAPDIMEALTDNSIANKVTAIGTLAIDAFSSIMMNADFWLSMKVFGIIGAQGVADVFTGGAAQAASYMMGAVNDVIDTALFLASSSAEYNSLYGA